MCDELCFARIVADFRQSIPINNLFRNVMIWSWGIAAGLEMKTMQSLE
jgi:hypothetical protein